MNRIENKKQLNGICDNDFKDTIQDISKVDFQAGERVGALGALYSLNFGVQRPPLSQILKIHLRGRKMPLGAYDRRCKLRNMAWLKRILRCHSRGCDKKEVIDTKKQKQN